MEVDLAQHPPPCRTTEEEQDFQPRDYQVKLMEIALKNNTIIYLPTGTGKTFIAVMILKRLSLPLNKSFSQGGKLSVMVVNTVALVDQQSKYIQRFTPFDVGSYCGDMNVDMWNKETWLLEFEKYPILVMTAQILANLLEGSFISLDKINLLIFDECHRGVNDHSMRQIMKHCAGTDVNDLPRFVGLTATLLNKTATPHMVLNELKTLETTFHSKIATVDELKHVIGHATNPNECVKIFPCHNQSTTERTVLNKFDELIILLGKCKHDAVTVTPPKAHLQLLNTQKGLKDLVNLIEDTKLHLSMLGAFGGKLALVAHMILLERMKKHCQEQHLAIILDTVVTAFLYIKRLLENEMKVFEKKDQLYKYSSQQVHILIEILKEYQNKSQIDMCGLIFVQRRFTAKVLYNILLCLKEFDPDLKDIAPNFIVGFNCNPYNDTREGLYNTKMNRKVLQQFQNKEVNLLVASSVLEEGVDIQTCGIVIKFDKVLDYRSYIQSKGRARSKGSFYYMMVEGAEYELFCKKYHTYQNIESMLNYYLIGQNEIREGPTAEDIQELYDEDELPPYYVNGPQSSCVTLVSAISLLCRYCLSLPSDSYTTYVPNWFLETKAIENSENGALYKVILELPLVSPILQPIEGPFMRTKKMAKRAAALKACEILHKSGELDDNLLPKRHDVIDEDTSFLFTHWPAEPEKSAGNLKMRRRHVKKIPHICRGMIKPNENVYLHVINLNPLFVPHDPSHIMLHNVYSSQLTFGVLSSNPFPKLCPFSLFVTLGEIEVEFNVNQQTIGFNSEEIMHIRAFHCLVFKDILGILKHFLMFDNAVDAEALLIVPVLKDSHGCKIDFDVILNHKQLVNQKSEPNDQEKLQIVANEENYLGKIVTPWYRPDDQQYVVVNICNDMNPLSTFPSEDFITYADYFHDKYHAKVLNANQPLLLVKGLSKRMNYFKPRHSGPKRSREKVYQELDEHLIPELCAKQEFPSALWIQASLLPSILFRLTSLLQADEVRASIAAESGLGVAKLTEGQHWEPLVLDMHLLNYVNEESSPKKKVNKDEETVVDAVISPRSLVQEFAQDFTYKKLEAEFPWAEIDEPVDIERRLDVTLMDIQYYENFISQTVTMQEQRSRSDVKSKVEYPAITFDKDFIEKEINLLNLDAKVESLGPELREIYKVFSTAKCNDVVNLERLETLGDSFLKLSISLFILLRFPKFDEGKATILKGKLISNKNLYYVAAAKNLDGYIKLSEFTPKSDWKPPSFCVPNLLVKKVINQELPSSSLFNFIFSTDEQVNGSLTPENLQSIQSIEVQSDETQDNYNDSMFSFFDQQTISDKTVADSIEALIGAYFQSHGMVGGLHLLQWLGIIPSSENVVDLLKRSLPDPILNEQKSRNIDFHIPFSEKIEEKLGYKFQNRAYLLQALTHSSYTPNRITSCYQKLEFLGDAILDFLITCHIYETCDYLDPGHLTDLRSALVNNITFAGFSVRHGFHKFLLFSNKKLLQFINNFVDVQENKNFIIDDEVLMLLEQDDLYLSENIDVPKVLGDVFEALAGAIFLDSGMNLQTVWKVFYRIMWKEIELFRNNVPKNAIRILYETLGAHPEFQAPIDINTGDTMVGLHFMLNGVRKRVYGFGKNKILAKKAAAKIAVRLLHN